MRLDRIELKNYRCYEQFQVSFQPGFNVIAGVNGSGKTSLLKGIKEALTCLTLYMPLTPSNYFALSDEDLVRIHLEGTDGRFRFEPKYPVEVNATGEAFGETCTWGVGKPAQPSNVSIRGTAPGSIWQQRIQATLGKSEEQEQPTVTLPLIAFYPANRHWPPARVNELGAATGRVSRTDGYRFWWDAATDAGTMQQWIVAKSQERLELATEQVISWDAVTGDELDVVNTALAAVVEGAKALRYNFAQKTTVVEWTAKEVSPTPFQNLSDGQRVAIALVVDIARRMCVLNPHLGSEVTRQTPGVVLVDEIDIHLHPKWQRLLTKGLPAAFPLVQFIVTSHSPQVLGELHPEQILLLRSDGAAHPLVSYGLDSNQVLEQIMEAMPRPAEIQKKLSALFEAIDRNRLTSARTLLDSLKTAAPGLPELAGAEALLKRKEVLGR